MKKFVEGKDAGSTCWYGYEDDSIETFNERWKIIYTPPE